MSGFMVYWSKDYLKELKAAGDSGPIKVIYGGPHSTMPSIESVEVGDIVYPVTIANGTLCVLARLPIEKKEIAFHYVLRETGEIHQAIKPDNYAEEVKNQKGESFFSCGGHAYNSVNALPENTKVVFLSDMKELPHKFHQKPKTCCAELAAWGRTRVYDRITKAAFGHLADFALRKDNQTGEAADSKQQRYSDNYVFEQCAPYERGNAENI